MNSLGLASISFRKNSPKEILEAMSAAGLSLIEWGSDIHAPIDSPTKIQEILDLQSSFDITCCSYGTYFRLGENEPEMLKTYIQTANRLGTNILRIWCGTKAEPRMDEEEKSRLFHACEKAARIAENEKAILCLECHHSTYTETFEATIALMKRIDSPNFRMYWQPNQYRSVEENLQYAEAIAPFTKHIHVFQWHGDEKLPLRFGVEEWKQYLRLFKDDHALLLEFMPDGKLESLKTEAEALKYITAQG